MDSSFYCPRLLRLLLMVCYLPSFLYYQVFSGFCFDQNPMDHHCRSHHRNPLVDCFSYLLSYLFHCYLACSYCLPILQYSLQISFFQRSLVFLALIAAMIMPVLVLLCCLACFLCSICWGTTLHIASSTSLSPIEYLSINLSNRLYKHEVYPRTPQ